MRQNLTLRSSGEAYYEHCTVTTTTTQGTRLVWRSSPRRGSPPPLHVALHRPTSLARCHPRHVVKSPLEPPKLPVLRAQGRTIRRSSLIMIAEIGPCCAG